MSDTDQVKYANLLGDWLVELGYTHCFMVAGGGCMHLIDGFRTRFECIPVVHEVTTGIAAEHFNECSGAGKKAFALVTSGPGLTNVVTAIAGCYTERRELLVIAGQVKSTDLRVRPLRQRGVQEIDGTSLVESIAVAATCLKAPVGRAEFQEMVRSGWSPHPGPVVIEVCLDVQGAKVARGPLETRPEAPAPAAFSDEAKLASLVAAVSQAKRPLLLLGGLVSRKLAWDSLPALLRLGIPVATTTSAIDRVPSAAPIYAGRPSTWGGQRAANMIVAQADVVVAIGAQLDLQQTGFNWQEYAPGARLYQVFPAAEELAKGHPVLAGDLDASPDAVFSALLSWIAWEDKERWGDYVRQVRTLVPTIEPANTNRPEYVSPFVFARNLSLATEPTDILALCSSGGTFTSALQTFEVAERQYATTSPAFASMGYGLGTAIGAALAQPGRRVILTEGDGGFAQNLQELALVRRRDLPIKIFVAENHGYGSIRATQRKFFNGAYVGCDHETGLGFPDWVALFNAFGIPARRLTPSETTREGLGRLIAGAGPEAWVVPIDPEQSNWPAVSSRILPDGRMQSNPLYQMLPPLPAEVQATVGKYLPVSS